MVSLKPQEDEVVPTREYLKPATFVRCLQYMTLDMSLKLVFQSDFRTLRFMMLGILTHEARVFAFP